MKTIGIRQLRQRASDVLRSAEKGVSFQVTDRGRPLALISPWRAGTPLEELRAIGDVAGAKGDINDLPDPMPLPRKALAPSKILARMRSHER